ncbi:MAG: DUF4157 domain-containing protein [Thermoanaerobaculia bacterium]
MRKHAQKTAESPQEHAANVAQQRIARAPAPALAKPDASDRGAPLDPTTREFMEQRLSHDFGRVRVFAGPNAAASSRAMGAHAYTRGSDVYFGAGRYSPGLLAHELTHVAQGAGSIQRKPKAERFQDEPTLDEISEGKKVLKNPDKGEAVVRISTALYELGHYKLNVINQDYDGYVAMSVENFQKAKSLAGVTPGEFDRTTFDALDGEFAGSDYKVERGILAKEKLPELEKNTQYIDRFESKAAMRAVSTETPATASPTFKPDIPPDKNYKKRLTDVVEKVILRQYNSMGKDKGKTHATEANLFGGPLLTKIAGEGQNAVNSVFGEYTAGKKMPPLTFGTNVEDAWDKKVKELKDGGTTKEDESAEWRVQKILDGNATVAALDQEHGAIQSRADEKKIVTEVREALVKKWRKELLETHKGWPGFADPDKGKIYVQRFKKGDFEENRLAMWKYYQTFIHEYLHLLEHKDHRTWRGTLGAQKGNMTLREGTADYFTRIVWSSITIDDALRARIELDYHIPGFKGTIPDLTLYKEWKNAERLAGIVGIRNVAGAFFLGKIELIKG